MKVKESQKESPVVQYVIEHTRYVPTFDEYERYERETGEMLSVVKSK